MVYNGDTDPCVSYEGTRNAIKQVTLTLTLTLSATLTATLNFFAGRLQGGQPVPPVVL